VTYTRNMLQTLLERRADQVMEAYVGWKEACCALERAYAAWNAAPRHERTLACAAHVAALDREQHAALVYACAIERFTRPRPPLLQGRSPAS
jgi:hypothetical protein